jgi:hypothetical protein
MSVLRCALFLAFAAFAGAQNTVIYNSIPKPLPPNVASEGPEAYGFSELGDGIQFAAATGSLGKVDVVMSSWGCQSGNWYSGTCVSTPGASFSQELTITVYSVVDPLNAAGAALGSITQTFNLPYRPTSTPAQCGGDATVWYNAKDKSCYHGAASSISVNFASLGVAIPANGKLIVTVKYNMSHYGPNPIGEGAACYATTAGCPYDSLNISTDGNGPSDVGGPGIPVSYNGIFVNYTIPNTACSPGTVVTGVLGLDDGCWTGYHPQIQVVANVNPRAHGKGNK